MKTKKVQPNTKAYHNQLVAASIHALPQQMKQVVSDWAKVTKPRGTFRHIIVCGMGGSALGADIVRYALADKLRLPIRIINNYQLPAFVSKDTLVVVSSYSGGTEESIACYREAKRKRLPLFVITTGGKLAQLAQADKVPSYIFEPKFNPSKQPRLGLGYGMASLLMLLSDIKASPLKGQAILKLVKTIRQEATAKEVNLIGKRSVIVFASEHLIGVAHALSNQLNETAKTFAPYFSLPELNHHLLEGLASLRQPKQQWIVLALSSKMYFPATCKRYALTEGIFRRQKFTVYDKSFSGDRLTQALRCLYWSASLTYKVAVAQGLDTTAIPWVDYFKQQLKN